MNNKVSLLTITLFLTIIVFMVSTNIQKKMIGYEPKIKCLILNEDVKANQKLTEDMFKTAELPVSYLSNTKIIESYNEIDGMYAKDDIYKTQIALKEQFDTKENLMLFEIEDGKERISLKVDAPENGLSFAIRENSTVNVYATIRSDYAKNFLPEKERLIIGDEYDGYAVIKLLENIKVLGVFNVDGIEVESINDGIIDSIMIPVTNEEAKQINLLRDIASFNITGVSDEVI